MKESQLKKLLKNHIIIDSKIKFYLNKKQIIKQQIDKEEIKGHIAKAKHNLLFIADTSKKHYPDWILVGCYYATYHIALALIMKKGFSSKNHDATLTILIKYYYKKGFNEEEINLLNNT